MSRTLRTRRAATAVVGAAGIAAVVFATVGSAAPGDGVELTNVPTPNPKAVGLAPAPKLSPELQQIVWAQGSTRVENPTGLTAFYGYQNDVVTTDDPTLPQMVPTPANPNEAQKTEPDKNTYLVFDKGLSGFDPDYNYGTHFLFQGHEIAARNANGDRLGYITRINLDADAAHRVTVLATKDTANKPIFTIDGSTWDPWAHRLLFTTESATAPTYAATPNYPSTVEDVSGALGRGGYEGIQNDSDGNLWICEDIGGSNKPGGGTARQPNSYVFRYTPDLPGDLYNGILEALQVLNESGQPITFDSLSALNPPDGVALHTYRKVFTTRWVTVHDTSVNGTAPFNANTLAKAAKATPFKRPENGLFRPKSHFQEFYFDETGDTNATSPENGDPSTGIGGAGGWGSILKLTQPDPSAHTGRLTLFFAGRKAISGLDNNAFLSKDQITFVEDAGDTLHTQRKAFDSGYVFDLETDYSKPASQPVRWLAEGRDASATIDSANGGFGGKNDQDNEITGTYVSDGDPSERGILGRKEPKLFENPHWRWFWTQQHGDNVTYEVVRNPAE